MINILLKNKTLLLLLALLVCSCTKTNSLPKPALSLEAFDKEAQTLEGMIQKFVDDNDPSRVHEISLGIESSLAVECKPVGDECFLYHKIVTAIIQATSDRKFTLEEKIHILKMKEELHLMLQSTRKKLTNDWNNYRE